MGSLPNRVLLPALCLAALAVLAAAAAAAEAPTRPEYVSQLEQICQPGSEATQRAVKGVRHDVRSERLAVAGTKFLRAKRIFAGTVRKITVVPRPTADAATLERWFKALDREKQFLGLIVAALHSDDVPRFQRVSGQFIHQGNRANNVVVSFGFNYCSFKPSRFQ
jgi:hypothetical protein